MDVEILIGEVAARNGIRIEPDDPAFALVTLNQLVLEEAVKNLVREIRAATADFESAAERVQQRGGTMLAREICECLSHSSVACAQTLKIRRAQDVSRYSFSTFYVIALFVGMLLGHILWP
ncbi:MAG: hypothetical protein QJR10_04710 [Bacillota bacterium]|nr:hypothetical protein [Bacillota bacterium]